MVQSIYFVLHSDGNCGLSVQKNLFYSQKQKIECPSNCLLASLFIYTSETQYYQGFYAIKT